MKLNEILTPSFGALRDLTQNRWSSENNVSLLKHCRVVTEEDKVKSQISQIPQILYWSLRSKSEENLI